MVGFIKWIDQYDLFLFDFDGLLVNTEFLHYNAYQKMCRDRGFTLLWDFSQYCGIAHMGSDFLQKSIYETFPQLHVEEPNWPALYKEKQKAFLDILEEKGVLLMPGVEQVLHLLHTHKTRSCVVTHSPSSLTDAIRKRNPVLNLIPHWVTREQYELPKPEPDAYLAAVRLYGKPADRILGFEDTIRGWKALHAAHLESIVVSPLLTQEMKQFLREKKVSRYQSFEELLS